MFEIVFAYLAVVIMLSTLVTALLEVAQRLTPMRSWFLQWSLDRLLQRLGVADPGVRKQQWERFRSDVLYNPVGLRFPDYVGDALLRHWLRSLHAEGIIAPKDPALVGKADEALYGEWVAGFNGATTRSYKALMVVLAFGLGLVSTRVMEIDALGLAEHLQQTPDETAVLVEMVEADGGDAAEPEASVNLRRYFEGLEGALRERLECPEPAEDARADEACERRVFALMERARTRKDGSAAPRDWARAAALVREDYWTLQRDHGDDVALRRWLDAAECVTWDLIDDTHVCARGQDGQERHWPRWKAELVAAYDAEIGASEDPDAHRWLVTTLGPVPDGDGPIGFASTLRARKEALPRPWTEAELTGAVAAAEAAQARMRVLVDRRAGIFGVWQADDLPSQWLGHIIIAALIALGAPFWFDLLNRLSVARRPSSSTAARRPGDPPVISTDT